MAREIIPQEPPIGKDWEEEVYQEGCAALRREAQEKLEALDDRLHAQAPPGWQGGAMVWSDCVEP